MGIKTPFISEIAKDTYAINEYGLDAMFLVVGKDSALLIDTGCGACDLKTTVAHITDKPYKVALTHAHMDHVGGIGAFEEIYLNEGDFEMARMFNHIESQSYADTLGKAGAYDVYDYSSESIEKINKFPKFIAINDGYIFDLGDRAIEAIHIPGHTDGGICFLDDTTQILFSGDCCNSNLLAQWSSITTTLRALYKLKTYEHRFTRNFNGHLGYAGIPECKSLPDDVLDNCIHILKAVLNGEGISQKIEFLGMECTAMNYGHARVVYDPKRLIDDGEEAL